MAAPLIPITFRLHEVHEDRALVRGVCRNVESARALVFEGPVAGFRMFFKIGQANPVRAAAYIQKRIRVDLGVQVQVLCGQTLPKEVAKTIAAQSQES